MSTILIAESGSTKTDWVLVYRNNIIKSFKTEGINPYIQSSEQILDTLEQQCPQDLALDSIYFYGAGVSDQSKKQIVKEALSLYFQTKSIYVESDMLAAARGLSQNNSAVIAILGTGSNNCFYDGNKIQDQLPSLGFIAGDEGSGNHMGKRILQYYAYNTFDPVLKNYFERHFGNNVQHIVNKLYQEPFPNRYLASFVPLLVDNRGHYMVENIIEDCLISFFHTYLYKYRQVWNTPVCFTGSIAYLFSDVIKNICYENEINLGTILASPLEGLIQYHCNN